MNQLAKKCMEISRRADNETTLLLMAMICWLDPIFMIDTTYDEVEEDK